MAAAAVGGMAGMGVEADAGSMASRLASGHNAAAAGAAGGDGGGGRGGVAVMLDEAGVAGAAAGDAG